MSELRIKATVIGQEARGVFLAKAEAGCGTSARVAAGPALLGRIHSCFERVFNILVPEGSRDGADVLIGICRPGVPLSPLHLGVAWRSAISDLPIRKGEPILVTRRELVFPSLVVAWGEAEEYSTFFQRQERAKPEARSVSEPAVPAIGSLCARVVAEGLIAGPLVQEGLLPLIRRFAVDAGIWSFPDARPQGGHAGEIRLPDATGALSPTAARAFPVLCRLSAAVRERRQDRVFNAARELLGLGPGLTPSGDDFLTGLMLADFAWRRRFPSGPALGEREMWRRLAEEAAGLTGAISCQQIRLAADGAGNEVFERVCWRLSRADERVLSDIPALARFGATSGLDYLAGVVFALRHILTLSDGMAFTNPGKRRPAHRRI